jgi:hypothetical protein
MYNFCGCWYDKEKSLVPQWCAFSDGVNRLRTRPQFCLVSILSCRRSAVVRGRKLWKCDPTPAQLLLYFWKFGSSARHVWWSGNPLECKRASSFLVFFSISKYRSIFFYSKASILRFQRFQFFCSRYYFSSSSPVHIVTLLCNTRFTVYFCHLFEIIPK